MFLHHKTLPGRFLSKPQCHPTPFPFPPVPFSPPIPRAGLVRIQKQAHRPQVLLAFPHTLSPTHAFHCPLSGHTLVVVIAPFTQKACPRVRPRRKRRQQMRTCLAICRQVCRYVKAERKGDSSARQRRQRRQPGYRTRGSRCLYGPLRLG